MQLNSDLLMNAEQLVTEYNKNGNDVNRHRQLSKRGGQSNSSVKSVESSIYQRGQKNPNSKPTIVRHRKSEGMTLSNNLIANYQ